MAVAVGAVATGLTCAGCALPESPADGASAASADASVAASAPVVSVPPAPTTDALDASVGAAPCPDDMALVHGWFCPLLTYDCARTVDVSGYRCAQYARARSCRASPDLRRFCIDRHEWPNRVGELPLVYVSFDEAKAHCASVGKRLCRRSEWVLACEGPKRMPYPWGWVRQPSPCNIDRSPVPVDAFALERVEDRELELARLWQADPIGSHPDCVSSFGVYDLAGNVDEWTDNLADNPATGRPSTLNGGYWGPVRDTCRLTTKSHGPRFRFYQVGFRCCRDPLDGLKQSEEGPIGPPAPWLDPDPPDAGGEYAPARPERPPAPEP